MVGDALAFPVADGACPLFRAVHPRNRRPHPEFLLTEKAYRYRYRFRLRPFSAAEEKPVDLARQAVGDAD